MADMKDRVKNGTDAGGGAGNMAGGNTGGAGQGGQNDAAGLVDKAKDAAQHLRDRASDVVGQVRDKAQDWAGTARDSVQPALDKAQRWAGDAYGATTDQLGDLGDELTRLVRNHPLPAVLIGFGIGLLIGRTARML